MSSSTSSYCYHKKTSSVSFDTVSITASVGRSSNAGSTSSTTSCSSIDSILSSCSSKSSTSPCNTSPIIVSEDEEHRVSRERINSLLRQMVGGDLSTSIVRAVDRQHAPIRRSLLQRGWRYLAGSKEKELVQAAVAGKERQAAMLQSLEDQMDKWVHRQQRLEELAKQGRPQNFRFHPDTQQHERKSKFL